MSLVGFQARNHRQQVLVRGARPEVDDRATTPEVFEPLEARFRFTVDVAASERNRKLARFYTVDDDGLAQSWAGERAWCNPPYSNIGEWVEKAWAEREAELVVMLLPANRTEQTWWQEMVEPFRDREGSPLRTEFLPGRLRFIAHDKDRVEPNERPPFGCVLLIFDYVGSERVSLIGPERSEGPSVAPRRSLRIAREGRSCGHPGDTSCKSALFPSERPG